MNLKKLCNLLFSFALFSLLSTFLTHKVFASTGTFSYTGNMNNSRSIHTETLLQNGKVLIVGGDKYYGAAELYDSTTGTFSLSGNLVNSIGDGSTATLLQNGKVLITGGINSSNIATPIAEVYDPINNSFSQVGNMNYGREFHT